MKFKWMFRSFNEDYNGDFLQIFAIFFMGFANGEKKDESTLDIVNHSFLNDVQIFFMQVLYWIQPEFLYYMRETTRSNIYLLINFLFFSFVHTTAPFTSSSNIFPASNMSCWQQTWPRYTSSKDIQFHSVLTWRKLPVNGNTAKHFASHSSIDQKRGKGVFY